MPEGRHNNHYHHESASSGSISTMSGLMSEAVPSPKKRAKQYERKPRHKTKEDKYEVKRTGRKLGIRPRTKEKTNGAVKKDKKRKRKQRSGDALMHTFGAPNVAQDRLTVSA